MYSKDIYGEIEMVTMHWYVIYPAINEAFYTNIPAVGCTGISKVRIFVESEGTAVT